MAEQARFFVTLKEALHNFTWPKKKSNLPFMLLISLPQPGYFTQINKRAANKANANFPWPFFKSESTLLIYETHSYGQLLKQPLINKSRYLFLKPPRNNLVIRLPSKIQTKYSAKKDGEVLQRRMTNTAKCYF